MSAKLLADVNIWVALLAEDHAFHAPARAWYRDLDAGQAGFCRLVQLSVVRLLGSSKVVGSPIPASVAWRATEALLEDQRVEFVPEPADLGQVISTLFRYRVPTPQLVTDAYLAAFAISAGRRFVTWDNGFGQFQGLDVQIL